jgi:hypothetical protein
MNRLAVPAERIARANRKTDYAAVLWKIQLREKAAYILDIELFRRDILG